MSVVASASAAASEDELLARPADAPVVMVNLLKFRADSGRASYARYAQEVGPHLQRVGGTVRYADSAPTQVIGDSESPWWDPILVVEYPSPAAFIDMSPTRSTSRYMSTERPALDRGDLIATSKWSMAD